MRSFPSRKWVRRGVLLLLLAMVCAGFYNPLRLTEYTLRDPGLPAGLAGYRIVQVSDLHGTCFGAEQETLIRMIREAQPDLILLTGDILDKRDDNVDHIRMLLEGIRQLAPIYAVAGNHEYANYMLNQKLSDLYRQYGVTELRDEGRILTHNGVRIYLYGVAAFHAMTETGYNGFSIPKLPEDGYGILLYHFSTDFETIADTQSGYSLLFTGHSHGGIVRLPLLGPVFGNQGTLFPQYAGGLFVRNGLTMVASRGMSQSRIPRFCNPMELVCVTLTA